MLKSSKPRRTSMSETLSAGQSSHRSDESPIAAIAATNTQPLSFIVNMETAALREMIEASNDILQRAHSEMHVIAEFASKLAEAHSVAGVTKAYEDCVQHQADILRQDGEKLFRHGRDVLGKVSEIVSNYLPRPPLP